MTIINEQEIKEQVGDVEYAFGPHPDDKEKTVIKISSGKYNGTVVDLSPIKPILINEGQPDESLSIQYVFEVLYDSLERGEEEVKSDVLLEQTVAAIVMDLLQHVMDKATSSQ